MTQEAVSRTGKLPLHIRSALRDDAEDESVATQKSGVALRPTTGKLANKLHAFKALQGHSATRKMDSQIGGTLPRTFDILLAKELPGTLNLMADAYIMAAAPSSGLPPVRPDSGVGATRVAKSSLASHAASISNAMHLFKPSHQPLSLSSALLSAGSKSQPSQPAVQVRDQVLLDVCHSAGAAEMVLDSKGDTLTSLVLQVPKSFRARSVNAMQLQPCGLDSAEAKSFADKNINQRVVTPSQISGQKLPISSDFLKTIDFGTEPIHQSELDDPTILLLQGSGISLTDEVPLPEGCTIVQKHRKDGKNEIRIDLSSLPPSRTEAQQSLLWFLKEWKKLEDFDADRSISNVQTAWAVLSVSFMDVTRQNFLICKERGAHLQHLWVHLSSFACRGITLAQTLAGNFAASEVKYLQTIRDFDAKFTSELDMLHKFYQKQLNLAWNTEERYKTIILGLEKDKTELTAQLFAVRESALYSEVVALKTFYMNFAQNTKFLRDLVVDATTDWSKRASNSEQRLKAKYAGEVESVEKLANTIGESDQQTWELKMNDLFANKAASDREFNAQKETNALLTAEVMSLREQLQQSLAQLKQSKLVAPTLDFTQQVSPTDLDEEKVVETKKKLPKVVVEKEKVPQVGLGSLLSLKARPEKPNIMSSSQLNKLIYELYDLKTAADKVDDNVSNFRQNMVQYFFEAYTNKFGLQAIADKQMWNFISSIQKHQSSSMRARLIGRFLGVVEPVLSMNSLNFFLQFRQRVNEINTGRKPRIYDEEFIGVSQMRILELVSKTFTRIKEHERDDFLSSFLKGVRVLNANPEQVSGDFSPDLDLDSVFERAIECDLAEGKMRTDETLAMFDSFSKLEPDQWGPWIQDASRSSSLDDVSAAVEKLQRSGDSPDLNSFVYATASVPSIRQAFFPLDAQVENKVLAKIQVLLRKVPSLPDLWKRLSGKKDKLFPDDFQESMCKLGLNLSKMEILMFFCLWDEDGDGFLSETELVLMMPVDVIEIKFRNMIKKKIEKDNTSLQGVFRFFDKDGEGKVSCEEFVQGCQALHIGILDSQAAALFKSWDMDGGGSIEFGEFKKCMDKDKDKK